MKILFITHTSSIFGANRSLLDLILCLKKLNYETSVIIPKTGPFESLLQKNTIPYKCFRYYPFTYEKNWKMLLSFPKYLLKTALSLFNFFPLLFYVKSKSPDIIYSNSLNVIFGLFLSKALRVPHVLHVRESFKNYNIKYPIHNFFLYLLFNKSNAIIFISKAIQAHYKKVLMHKSYNIVYDPIYSIKEICQCKPKHSFTKNPFIILTVGQLLKSKNQLCILKAFKIFNHKIPHSRLQIIGSGDPHYETQLKKHVKQENLTEKVEFLGLKLNTSNYYKHAACSVISSTFEVFGRVVIESFFSGTPVIGNQAGALPELISNGKNGYLFNGSPNDLALKIEDIYNETIPYEEMSTACKYTLLDTFNTDLLTKKIHYILQNLNKKK